MQAAAIFDFDLSIATPPGYGPSVDFIEKYKTNISYFENPNDACRGADLIVTDVWTSMGQELEIKQREAAFKGFQVDQKLMGQAKDDAIFMHCLPAERGREVTDKVIESSNSIVFDQAENRMHAQNAIMVKISQGL